MASFQTFASVSSTPVEITGGKVGSFKIRSATQPVRIGDDSITDSDGVFLPVADTHDLYVTSPDEVYVVSTGSATDVTVFHCR